MNLSKNLARLATAAMVASSLVTFAPANAATIVGAKDTMDRAEKGATALHTFTLPSATSATATTITFPTGFTVTSSTKGTVLGQVVTVPAETSPDGAVVTVTNPSTAGSYEIDIAGENSAAIAVAIVNDDTINVTATVDPSITFDVGAVTAGNCAVGFVSADYAIDLGHMNGNRKVAVSGDAEGTQSICTVLSTNATSGAVVTAKNANGADGLKSVSVSGDKIASTTGDVAANTPNYGMCVAGVHGSDAGAVTPIALDPATTGGVLTSSFVNSSECAAGTAHAINAFGASAQNAWQVNGVTSRAFVEMNLQASISATQPAHNDYTDSITFVATATF